MRHEILALYDSQNNDPAVCYLPQLTFRYVALILSLQFFPMCTNLIITGDGSSPLPEAQGIKLPGGYRADDPFLHVNIWDGSLEGQNYVAPGPPVFTPVRAHHDAFARNFARSNRRNLPNRQ